jgi:16S rRNA (uracil1498-N3)-methyltransferase
MRTVRFFCSQLPAAGGEALLDPEESRHAMTVLRLRPGDRLELLDGKGAIAQAELLEPAPEARRRDPLHCRILDRRQIPEPGRRLHLFIAPPKGRLMHQIVRDATELGAWSITPVICRFSVSDPLGKDPETIWGADIAEACKQSGNPFMPKLHPPQSFAAALATAPLAGCFGAVPRVATAPPAPLPSGGDLAIWIGPEGGFSDEEHQALLDKGFVPLAASPWILRVETAVAAVLGSLQSTLPTPR